MPNVKIHVTGFDFKSTIAIMYFLSTNRQDEDFLNLLMILGSLCQLHCLQILQILLQHKKQIFCNRQILASFASRINRKRLLLNKKRNGSGRSCWVKPGRTNGRWEKFLNNKVADTDRIKNFRMS